MPDAITPARWRPTRTTVVAGSMVLAGFLLTGLSWWFLLLAALGACGPGALREMGWLADRDEFQRRADYRAGYHAFLTGGFVAFGLLAFFRSGDRSSADANDLATLFLAVLWFTWFLSSLLTYWGPQKAAARILRAFGSVWLIFIIIANTGSEWTGWPALLLTPLLLVPFFAAAWLARRSPRITGVLLLAASVFLFQFFGMFQRGNLGLVTQGVTFILFLGPLIASGVALLGMERETEETAD